MLKNMQKKMTENIWSDASNIYIVLSPRGENIHLNFTLQFSEKINSDLNLYNVGHLISSSYSQDWSECELKQ